MLNNLPRESEKKLRFKPQPFGTRATFCPQQTLPAIPDQEKSVQNLQRLAKGSLSSALAQFPVPILFVRS